MSRLPMLPVRVPAAAARVSRPEDPRSVAEALYDESLGDIVGSMLCKLLDLHANRTGQNTARHAERIFSGAVGVGLGADAQDWRS
jgi:hypothetical protein